MRPRLSRGGNTLPPRRKPPRMFLSASPLTDLAAPGIPPAAAQSSAAQGRRGFWLFLYNKFCLHSAMSKPTDMRTGEAERSRFVGCELNRGGLAFLKLLLDVEGRQLESVVMINRGDQQLHMLALLHVDRAGSEFVFLRRHGNFVDACHGAVRIPRLGKPEKHCKEAESTDHK